MGALQIPYIQTKATQKAAEILSKKLNHPISVGGIDISWLDTAILDEVCLQDEQKDTILYIQETYIDFQLFSLLSSEIKIDNVFLVNPKMNIFYKKEVETLNINHFINSIMNLFKKTDNTPSKQSSVQILTATLHNASFEYFHPQKDSIKHINAEEQFNYHHFSIEKVFTHLEQFNLVNDTIAFQVIHLSGHEKNNDFTIKDLNTQFLYSKKCLEFQELDAYIQESYLSDFIRFDYNEPSDFSKFITNIKITANLEKSIIYTKDLGYFAPDIAKFDDKWTLSGKINGTVADLKIKKLQFSFGKESNISGNIKLKGLPKIKETFMQINLKESKLVPTDLKQYLPKQYYDIAHLFGQTNFSTNLVGFSTNFVTDGIFKTAIGTLDTDLKFDIQEDEALSKYGGKVKTVDFDLGKFLSYEKLGKLDMDGNIEGTGFKIENADVKLTAKIKRLGYNNYDYKNISTDSASFNKKSFIGKIKINDPNLKASLDGSFSLDGNQSLFNISTSVTTANLLPLNLTKEDIGFKIGFSHLSFEGLELDSIRGIGFTNNATIFYKGDSLSTDFLSLSIALQNNSNKQVKINSEFLEAELNGNFDINNTYKELLNTIHEYSDTFYDDPLFISSKKYEGNHQLFYNITLKDVNPILQFIEPKLYISQNSTVFGQFTYGNEHNLQIQSLVDSFSYDNLAGKENSFFLDSHKSENDTVFEANVHINNSLFYIDSVAHVENSNIEALWKKDTIDFSSHFKQNQRSNTANLIGKIALNKENISLNFIESDLNLLQDQWVFDQNNQIDFFQDSIAFTNFNINYKNQKIGLEGSFGKDTSNALSFVIDKFNLQNLKKITDVDLNGLVNSKMSIENFKNKQLLEGTMLIEGLATQGILLGDINGTWYWDNHLKWFVSNTKVVRNKKIILSLDGFYNLNDKENPLHYNVRFERTPLLIAQEFANEHISNVKGYIDGNVKINGSFKKPSFDGRPMLHCQKIKINYLQTAYRVNNELVFKGDSILFENFQLNDTKQQTKVNISGGLKHQFFTNIESDLKLHLNKSLIIDTKEGDNPLFYGKILASGDIHLKGPFDDLKIISKELRTEKGSAIYIPLNSEETIATKDYIKFVNNDINDELSTRTDLIKKSIEDNVNLSGLLLDFNLFITPETYFEIIFDEQAGEKIKVYGGGNLQVVVDTRGDFKMSGIYEIKKGTYNFTLANFINKQFDIAPNSKIVWNGSPYDGTLDIQARYEQNASLAPLINDTTFLQNNPDARRAVKTAVLLNLNGSLLSPEIKFGIDVPTYPRYLEVEQAVQNLFSTINFNEQELNKQVFSLMVLKQFSALNEFSLNLGSSSASTVSELLSNQFSSWISQFDENLQINIDMSGFDEEANNNFRVKMSYDILDGKMRLTREGDVTNTNNQNQLANVFGEWTIEYLITDDGKIKMKAYNRTQNNVVTSSGNNNTSMIVGGSLTHTADFDNLRELFRNNDNIKEVDDFSLKTDTTKIEIKNDSTLIDSIQLIEINSTQIDTIQKQP